MKVIEGTSVFGDPHTLIATEKGLESLAQVRARRLCSAHIERYYPTYKQLNIMRTGSVEEVAKMGAFIDACRGWSDSDQPEPAVLLAIVP